MWCCKSIWRQNKELCDLNRNEPTLTATDTNISRTLKYGPFIHIALLASLPFICVKNDRYSYAHFFN